MRGGIGLIVGLGMAFVGCQQGSKAPALSNAAASASNQGASALVAPPKDYQKLGQALNTGLFLGNAAATLKASGGGTYKLTTAGYQYYNAAGQATNWFGQKGSNGNWALTQANEEWTGGQPSFAGQATWTAQKTTNGSWSGQWQTYDNGTYKPTGFSTTYNTATTASTNPWQTTWGQGENQVVWNAAAPIGKPANNQIFDGMTSANQIMPQAQQFSILNNRLDGYYNQPTTSPELGQPSESSPEGSSAEEAVWALH